MSRRLVLALVATWTVVVLIAPGLLWLGGYGQEKTSLQNRKKSGRPSPTTTTVADGTFGKALAEWAWDVVPYRRQLLRFDHTLDYRLLGDSPTPDDIVLGENGFVFLTERIGGSKAGKVDTRSVIKLVRKLQKILDKRGVRLVVSISPIKGTLYPEYLPEPHRTAHQESTSPLVEAIGREARRPGSPFVDGWGLMLADKARRLEDFPDGDPRRYLFRPLDKHWNLEAGRIQAKGILDRVDPNLWQEDIAPSIDDDGYVSREAELSRIYFKMALQERYTTATLSRLRHQKTSAQRLNSRHRMHRFTSTALPGAPPVDPRKIAVIRDSFLNGGLGPHDAHDAGIPTLASFFAETKVVHWDHFLKAPKEYAAAVADVDVLVIQVVQGHIYHLVKDAHLLETLARTIADRPPIADKGEPALP